MVIHKSSGKIPYFKIRNDLIDPDLVGGYLTALQSLGNELISKTSSMKEVTFEDFQIKLEDGEYTRIALILLKNPSKSIATFISNIMTNFIEKFEVVFNKKLRNWDGSLNSFKSLDFMV